MRLKPMIQESARENSEASGKLYGKGSQISVEPIKKIDTQKELAKIADVSHDTIMKVEKIKEKGTADQINRFSDLENTLQWIFDTAVDLTNIKATGRLYACCLMGFIP